MVAIADAKRHAARIVRRLKAAYPDARCALNFSTPLELLVATILSAQCTDTRVNIVTKDLFRKFPDARAYARAKRADLERAIQSTGFFRNKAKSIAGTCEKLAQSFGGEVPRDLDELVRLPGIGRKTANVVLGTAFGIPTGVVVDTHVARVSRRLGMTRHSDPVKIERDLMAQLPKREWIDFAHRVIAHGRRICLARKPKCEVCPLADVCPKIGVATSPKARRRTAKPSTAK
jgi:endonuclease-3